MNFPLFISKRLTLTAHRTFSRLIVRVAIIGIMLSLAIMILAVAVLQGFKNEIISKERSFNSDIAIFSRQLGNLHENAPFALGQDTLNRIASLKGIQSVQPYAVKPGIINVNSEVEGVILKGIDSAYDQHGLNNMLTEGRVLDFADSVPAQQQILISSYTANRLKLKTGDDFIMYFVQESLRRRKFTVVGIFSLGIEEIDKTYVISDISLIRRINKWEENVVGGYEIRLDDFSDIEQVNGQVSSMLPTGLFSSTIIEDYPEVFEWLDLLDINSQIILILMIAVSVINMISALLIMILERTEMIGVLKSLGMTNKALRRVFLYQATFIIGIGLFLGNGLGGLIYYLQSAYHIVELDEAAYYMSFVPVDIGFKEIFVLNIGTLIVCLLVLIIPSRLIMKIDPVKAIRFK